MECGRSSRRRCNGEQAAPSRSDMGYDRYGRPLQERPVTEEDSEMQARYRKLGRWEECWKIK